MPFKSASQKRKFGELVSQGKMSQQTFDEWNRETPANLPERIGKKKTSTKAPQSDLRKRFGLK